MGRERAVDTGPFWAALLGAALSAAAVAWLLGGHSGDVATFRAELRQTEVGVLSRTVRMAERLAELERRLAVVEGANGADSVGRELAELSRNVRRELLTVDEELKALRARVEEVAGGPPVPETSTGPMSEDERTRWAAQARDDPEPGGRFSALVMLGREHSDIAVGACLDRLADADEEPIVLWQALQALGRFGDRAVAPDVAAMLDHETAIVRAAAHDALRLMGAPETDFDAVAPADERSSPTARLKSWAAEQP